MAQFISRLILTSRLNKVIQNPFIHFNWHDHSLVAILNDYFFGNLQSFAQLSRGLICNKEKD